MWVTPCHDKKNWGGPAQKILEISNIFQNFEKGRVNRIQIIQGYCGGVNVGYASCTKNRRGVGDGRRGVMWAILSNETPMQKMVTRGLAYIGATGLIKGEHNWSFLVNEKISWQLTINAICLANEIPSNEIKVIDNIYYLFTLCLNSKTAAKIWNIASISRAFL